MQRKFLTFLFTLAALCLFALPAFADEVTNSVTSDYYTVSIPAEVTISPTTKTGEILISATLEPNTNVVVSINKPTGRTLKDTAGHEIGYTLSDVKPLVFSSDDKETTDDYTVTAKLSGKTPTYSGEYTDTLTFQISSTHWENETNHKLHFDVNAGTDSPAITITDKFLKEGETYGTLPTPVREGYDFKGWYTKENLEDGKVAASENDTMGDKDVELYAKWEVRTFQNTMTFWAWGFTDGEGNNGPKTALKLRADYTMTTKTAYGDTFTFFVDMTDPAGNLTMPEIPNGYHLSQFGSATVPNHKQWERFALGTSFKQPDHSVNAEYEYDLDEYKITYILDDGGTVAKDLKPTTYTVLYKVHFPEPTREGYTFAGWYDENGKEVTGINEQFDNKAFKEIGSGNANEQKKWEAFYHALKDRTTGNITVTAHWTKIDDSADSSDADVITDSDTVDTANSDTADTQDPADTSNAETPADSDTANAPSDSEPSDEDTPTDSTDSGAVDSSAEPSAAENTPVSEEPADPAASTASEPLPEEPEPEDAEEQPTPEMTPDSGLPIH